MNPIKRIFYNLSYKLRYRKLFLILVKPFGYCACCGEYLVYPKRRRMNTAYERDESNYCFECDDCFKETQAYWRDIWEEYNSQR